MSTGSKRPSPDAEEDPSAHRRKRSRSQDDTSAASRPDKGKAREVVSTPSLALEQASTRLMGLKCVQTSGEPTTSARAQRQAEEIAYLEQSQRSILAEGQALQMAQDIDRLSRTVAEQEVQITELSQHAAQLAQVREALKCGICFETLERPYALSPCGHVACHNCLLQWFNTTTPIDRRVDINLTNPITSLPYIDLVNMSWQDLYDVARVPHTPVNWASGGLTGRTGLITAFQLPRPFGHRPKTCPVCRTTVSERPLEMFAIRNAVEGLGEESPSSSHPRSSTTPNPTLSSLPHAPNPTGDPWNNLFDHDTRHGVNNERPPLTAVPPGYYNPLTYGRDALMLPPLNDIRREPWPWPYPEPVVGIQGPHSQPSPAWTPLFTNQGRRLTALEDTAGSRLPWLPEDPSPFGLRRPDGLSRCLGCAVSTDLPGRCLSCARDYQTRRDAWIVEVAMEAARVDTVASTALPSTARHVRFVNQGLEQGERVRENGAQNGQGGQQSGPEEAGEQGTEGEGVSGVNNRLITLDQVQSWLNHQLQLMSNRRAAQQGGLGELGEQEAEEDHPITLDQVRSWYERRLLLERNRRASEAETRQGFMARRNRRRGRDRDRVVGGTSNNPGPSVPRVHPQAALATNEDQPATTSPLRVGGTDEIFNHPEGDNGASAARIQERPVPTESALDYSPATRGAQGSDHCSGPESGPSLVGNSRESSRTNLQSSAPRNVEESGSGAAISGSLSDAGCASTPAISSANLSRPSRSRRTSGTTLASAQTSRSERTDTLNPHIPSTRQSRTLGTRQQRERELGGTIQRQRIGTGEAGTTSRSQETGNGNGNGNSRLARESMREIQIQSQSQSQRISEARRSRERERPSYSHSVTGSGCGGGEHSV